MSTHNIGFYEDLTKIIFELSSNMHLISSAVCDNHTANQRLCFHYIDSTLKDFKNAKNEIHKIY